MNYLAHAHLAYATKTSILGNLLGDFTKGINVANLPLSWQIGVNLHRNIDAYTDSHQSVLAMKAEFSQLRRYAGISLDIIFDHVIAKHFHKISSDSFDVLIEETHRSLSLISKTEHNLLPKKFLHFKHLIVEGQWLSHSANINHIERALHHTGLRLSTKPPLSSMLSWYTNDTERIDQGVLSFYSDLMQYTKNRAEHLQTAIRKID